MDDEAETWRSVGLLHGGTSSEPVQQTVTTACHHCVDPACMKGTFAAFDPYSRQPSYKCCAVQIRKSDRFAE